MQKFHAIDYGNETTTDKNGEAIYVKPLRHITGQILQVSLLQIFISNKPGWKLS